MRDAVRSMVRGSTLRSSLGSIGATLLIGVVVSAQTEESHQYRYLMGTSIQVQATFAPAS